MLGLYAAVFITLCAVKFHYYLYKDFDLAIFAQSMEQMLAGSLYTSVRGMCWLGDHSSLALFLILPVYAIFRHPLTLLVIQTLVLGLGALPVYWLARRELRGQVLPMALAAAYLLFPALGYTNLYEFHPETLAVAPLLFTFYYARERRPVPTLIFATLAVLCREDVALVLVMMAVYHGVTTREWRMPLGLTALAALSLLVTFGFLNPTFNRGEAQYASLFADWGQTTGEALSNMARHPFAVAERLYSTPGNPADGVLKQQYYLHMLLPVMFMPLMSPLALIMALPIVIEHMLSSRYTGHTIVFHYAALAIPGIMIATVLGTRNLMHACTWMAQRFRRRRAAGRQTATLSVWSIASLLVAAALTSNLMFGPVLGMGVLQDVKSKEAVFPPPMERTLASYIHDALERVPADGGVISGFEGLSHLTRHESLHSMHHLLCGRYTASDLPYPVPDGVVAIVADMRPLIPYLRLCTGTRMAQVIAENHLRPVVSVNDIVVFTRNARDTTELLRQGAFDIEAPAYAEFDNQLAFVGCDTVFVDARPGDVVTCHVYWRRVGPVDRSFYMQMGFFDATGISKCLHTRPVGYGVFPAYDWTEGVTVRETFNIIVPETLEPGLYDLSFRMKWVSNQGEVGVSAVESPIRATPSIIPVAWIRVVGERSAT